jgi:hypothetical protein
VFCGVAATLAVAILDVTTARIAATQRISLCIVLINKQLPNKKTFKYYLLPQTYWEPLRATALLIFL